MSSKLGFSEWPFHTLPDEDFVKVWCGRRELREKLERMFSKLVQRPGFQICLAYGDFGTGKTHSIRHMLKKYRESAKLLTSELEYDVTIRTFTQLYQSLVNRIDFEPIQDWATPPGREKSPDFESFYKSVRSDDQEKRSLAVRWLSGEEKSKRALNEINIRSPITDIDTSVRAFSGLTRLAGRNHSAIVLFIDEFQHVAKLNENWKTNILNGLTKLVNESPNHLCLIISFRLRMPMNILTIIPEGLVQRFSGDPFIEFTNFTEDEAEQFVECIFGKFRVSKSQNPYFPYSCEGSKAALHFLTERHVEYNPRSLMKIFGHISELFEESSENPPISEEFVRKCLDTYLP